MPGDRYVSIDKKVTFTPDGSSTPIDIGVYGRNFTWTRTAADINASAYGDDSEVHLVGRKDVNASMEVMYDDLHEIEDALVPGTKGILNEYPFGEVAGMRIRTMTVNIMSGDIGEPPDNVASGTVQFQNASPSGMTVSTVPT